MEAYFTLIENVEIYSPRPLGRSAILIGNQHILKVGAVEASGLESTQLGLEVIDGTNLMALPGFIDPHEHLIGGSGEDNGYASQTPEIGLHELIKGGITTVVGCLGVDTTTRTMPALLARVKALNEEGLTAFLYSGGYNLPPTTLSGSVRQDIMYCSEVIGAGEVAIADLRSTQPSAKELAVGVADAYVGGLLSGKAGVTHFHVGPGAQRLSVLREVLDQFDIHPESLYATHITRSPELIREAAALSRRKVAVDMDTVDEDLGPSLQAFVSEEGDLSRLTASSDAAINSPENLYGQFKECVLRYAFAIEKILPIFTTNTAGILKLKAKGQIAPRFDADILLVDKNSLRLKWVFARGRAVMRNETIGLSPRWVGKSNRRIDLRGQKSHE